MKAKHLIGVPPGGDRQKLSSILPLSTPLVIQFHVANLCNFKCVYCSYSLPKEQRPFTTNTTSMDFKFFKKCVDDLKQFPNKIKMIRFTGLGEPLIHKDIAKMVRYLSDANVSEKINITTNAELLTPKLSDQLVDSGLTDFSISIQGTSSNKYKDICGRDLDIKDIVSNIEYFYNHKKNTNIHIKTVDVAIDGTIDSLRFYKMFGDICDTIGIESIVPVQDGLLFTENYKTLTNVYGHSINNNKKTVCPQPFYFMNIAPDGGIAPCCAFGYPLLVGNCTNDSIFSIWNSNEFNKFRLKSLSGYKSVCKVCKECNHPVYKMYPEDVISEDEAKELKKHYE